ncbi:MAG: leucine-rich repeat protein [Clostridia bacterium]|nr:leucine-rich repeat protein [Clostridia bacterium]
MYIKEKDVYEIYKDGKIQLTPSLILKISGQWDTLDKKRQKKILRNDFLVQKVGANSDLRSFEQQENMVLFYKAKKNNDLAAARDMILKGLENNNIVITNLSDEKLSEKSNYFYIEKPMGLLVPIGDYITEILNIPRVCITGSVGKSTVSQLTKHIFEQEGKTFATGGNKNTYRPIVIDLVKKFDESYQYIVQETAGGERGLVEKSAKVLKPDLFCITNVWGHHLREYKTLENICYDKTSLDRYASDDAVGVINGDDELLSKHSFKSRIVKCSIKDPTCDYFADNIEQKGHRLALDIHNDGNTYSLSVELLGEYNAINVMFAFAMAKEYGIPCEKIIESLEAFAQKDRKRQFVSEVEGRTLIVDCFNVSVNSIKAGLEILDKYPRGKDDNTKIAMIGGENRVGEKAYDVNYQLGLDLANYKDIDQFIIYGHHPSVSTKEADATGDSHAVYDGAAESLGLDNIAYEYDMEQAAERLRNTTKPGDIIYFKGHVFYPMWRVIDIAFGTNYQFETRLGNIPFKEDGEYTSLMIKDLNRVFLKEYRGKDKEIEIPQEVDGLKVHAIGSKCFDDTEITKLKVECVPHICSRAFRKQESLKEIEIGDCMMINDYAFARCKNLETFMAKKDIPTIGTGVFNYCKKLTIYGPKDSNIEKYALEHNINFKSI